MKKVTNNFKPQQTKHLEVATEDHAILDQAMGSFRRLMTAKEPTKDNKDVAVLCQIFTDTLPGHFRTEENVVFPALMTRKPTHHVVHSIQKLHDEHVRLMLEACGLAKLISQPKNLRNGAAKMAMEQFFEDLRQHIEHEDALFGAPSNKRPA